MNIFTKLPRHKSGRGRSVVIKIRLQISVLVFLFSGISAFSQANYHLHIRSVDKDSVFLSEKFGLQYNFTNRYACIGYITKLPSLLQSRGYITAVIDSVRYDSLDANVVLYTGEAYQWAALDAKNIDANVLGAIGWRENLFTGKQMDLNQLQLCEDRILNYFENNGYPFAKIYLDSMHRDKDGVTGLLKAEKGPLYKIDSIRVFGNAKISNE